MTDELILRSAVQADLATLTALKVAAYAPYTELFGAPPLPVTEDYGPRIARDEVWLLVSGSTLLGAVVLEAAPSHLLIYSVAVAPGHQGAGHGVRLLDFAERQARALGVSELRLYTNSRMEQNLKLYAAHGYRETGRRPNPRRPGWILVDMAKPVVSAGEDGDEPPNLRVDQVDG